MHNPNLATIMVDYSKWDHLELSDEEPEETSPAPPASVGTSEGAVPPGLPPDAVQVMLKKPGILALSYH